MLGLNSPFSSALKVASSSHLCIGSIAAASAGEIEKNSASNSERSPFRKCPPLSGNWIVVRILNLKYPRI